MGSSPVPPTALYYCVFSVYGGVYFAWLPGEEVGCSPRPFRYTM